jgi:TPP-dependent pyruvate/acetoin dehydrogenase alpha subunit
VQLRINKGGYGVQLRLILKLQYVTVYPYRQDSALYLQWQKCHPIAPRQMKIADMFGARLEELKRIDEESNKRIQETIKQAQALIKELEAIDLETEY